MGVTTSSNSAATYEPIATQTLANSTTATITFSSIPSTYTDLILVSNFGLTANNTIIGRFNGDGASTGLYSDTNLLGNGTTASSNRDTSNNHFYLSVNLNGSTNKVESQSIIQFMNYANTTTYKSYLTRDGSLTATSGNGTEASVRLYRSTSAISSIALTAGSGSIYTGSTFNLYGIL